MHTNPRLFLLVLFALAVRLAGGESLTGFFPGGVDYAHYVPVVPGTPNGQIYVGEGRGNSPCHYRYTVAAGKTVKRIKIARFQDPRGDPGDLVTGIEITSGGDEITVVPYYKFNLVNPQGEPCQNFALPAKVGRIAAAGPAEPPTSFATSNSADSFDTTCDGRFAIVVGRPLTEGATPVPVSLVDIAAGREVDTLDLPGIGRSAAACDDSESVLVLGYDPPSNETTSVRRLRIVNAKLVDTGEVVRIPGTEANRLFIKVYAVPGSKVGVALGAFGAGLTTFSIPGLQVLDSTPAIFTSGSAVVGCAGDKVFLRYSRTRPGPVFYDEINGYTLDPVTGALGDTPFVTFDVAYHLQASDNFGDTLAISRDGTRLIVSEIAPFDSPATPRISLYDAATGQLLDSFDDFAAASAYPTLTAAFPCCVELPSPPVPSTVLFQKGDVVPGAGGGVGKPPADALLSSFGMPAIDADGKVAFTAKWTSATAGKGGGLFTDTASVAIVGAAVPGVDGATWKSFHDPLIDEERVAFLASLANVPKGAADAVASDVFGGMLDVIARTGDEAPGAGGATFKSFEAVGLAGTSVGFLAKLAAPKTVDVGLWATDGTHALTRLLSEGQMVSAKTVKTIVAFRVGNGSPGQGRGWLLAPAAGTQALALVTFTDLTQAVVVAGIDGTVAVLSQSGPAGTGGPDVAGANFASYGVPAVNASGHGAFAASLTVGAGGATKQNARGIFANLTGAALYTSLARVGDGAGTTGGTFGALSDAVLASNGALAFPAKLAGVNGAAKTTLWHQPSGGALTLLAQGGAPAPGTSGKWKAFTSLGLAGDTGPLFAATLQPGQGGVKASNANGVWATDTDGALRLYFRTGQTIDGKKLKSFSALAATPGTLGATRSFNDAGTVAWRATFTDKTTAIVTTEAP